MDAKTQVASPVSTPPFELEHLTWSNEGNVARTDDLDVARRAQQQFLDAGMSIIEA